MPNLKGVAEMKKKRQYNGRVKKGDKPMIEGTRWESKRGIFVDGKTGASISNPNPSLNPNGNRLETSDIIKHYASYLKKAKTADGYDWSEWNAKRLVWDLGNEKTLAAIRNTVSNFCKVGGIKFQQTLRSGNAATKKSEADKLKEFHEIYASAGLDGLTEKVSD